MNRNKIRVFSALIITFYLLLSCGGGSDTPGILDMDEGDGPALSASDTASFETLVRATVIHNVYWQFYDIAMMDFSAVKADLCDDGSVSMDIGDSSGDIELSGTYSMDIAANTINGRVDAKLQYEDYDLYDYVLDKNLRITGSAAYIFSGTANLGPQDALHILCAEDPDFANIAATGSQTEQISGSLAVSGDIGAAVSFNISSNASYSGTADDGSTNYSLTGNASVKSGGEIIGCSISRKYGDKDYAISCQ